MFLKSLIFTPFKRICTKNPEKFAWGHQERFFKADSKSTYQVLEVCKFSEDLVTLLFSTDFDEKQKNSQNPKIKKNKFEYQKSVKF